MSRDLGRDVPDLEKLYARKLWADFSYPKKIPAIFQCQIPRQIRRRNPQKLSGERAK